MRPSLLIAPAIVKPRPDFASKNAEETLHAVAHMCPSRSTFAYIRCLSLLAGLSLDAKLACIAERFMQLHDLRQQAGKKDVGNPMMFREGGCLVRVVGHAAFTG